MKACSKCKLEKDEGEFGKSSHTKSGLQYWCKPCKKASNAKYYKANPEKIKLRNDKYAATHKELIAAGQRRWRAANRDKVASYDKKQNDKDPGRARRGHLRRKYNKSDRDFEEMLRAQGGRCANPKCRTDQPGGNGNRFHIDHDHDTGRVRGLLCGRCNAAAGLLDDDRDKVYGLFEYLTSHMTEVPPCSPT